MALVNAKLYWLRKLPQDLSIYLHVPPILWCHNLGALSLATTNHIFHARTKHIEVDYHFNLEKVLKKYITLRFIFTQAQIAYLFIKGLTKTRFLFL